MKRKSGLFVFIFLFISTLFCAFFYAPDNSGLLGAQSTPYISSLAEEARIDLPEPTIVKNTVNPTGVPTGVPGTLSPEQSAAPVPYYSPDTATIIFTFDDGYVSDYELAYPILKEYGIRGTSYLIPKYQDTSKPRTLTWDMVKEMKRYGWVFGCHTYAHSKLTKLSADEIRANMLKVNASFLAQGLDPPKLHAFPFGRYDQEAIDAIKPFRVQMRKAFYEKKFVDPKTADPYEIDSCSADMRTEKKLKAREALVDKAIRQKAIIVFRCHCLYREKPGDMGNWPVQTDSRLFKKLVEYCVDKGCRFLTMTDLVQLCSAGGKQ